MTLGMVLWLSDLLKWEQEEKTHTAIVQRLNSSVDFQQNLLNS